jgi:hypothetical protein
MITANQWPVSRAGKQDALKLRMEHSTRALTGVTVARAQAQARASDAARDAAARAAGGVKS